ncbi:MAG: hypothetical protein IPK13_11435 [Deltaproteobacteria bacterium]|nr:hypothetical protein [Deltaproteobacteria bacterium]
MRGGVRLGVWPGAHIGAWFMATVVLVMVTVGSGRDSYATTPLEIRGNVALNAEVYRAIVDLSEATEKAKQAAEACARPRGKEGVESGSDSPDLREKAERVERQVLDFLKASGYDLAMVSVEPEGDHLVVEVDEGRLDKIVFVGETVLSTIQFKFAPALPGNVFNRPYLEEELERLVKETDVTSATYEVVPVQHVSHDGLQIVEPTLIRGLKFLKVGSPHELHVYTTHEVKAAGTDLGAGLSGRDGLYGTIAYSRREGFMEGDRLRLEARAGAHLGEDYRARRQPIGLARLHAALEWSTPPITGDLLRLRADLEADLFGGQRQDLNLARYLYFPLKAALNLEFDVSKPFSVSMGVGGAGRFLRSVRAYEGDVLSPAVVDSAREDLRLLGQARVDVVLNSQTLRRDHRGFIQVLLQGLAPGSGGSGALGLAKVRFEHVTTLGWDELRFSGAGAYGIGTPMFYDELNGGEFVRTCFSKSINVRRALGLGVEYRLSLSRDTLKVSAFNDAILHERLDLARVPIGTRLADVFGLGLHYLVADAFQVDFFLGLGIDPEEGADLDLALRIRQAF